MVMRYFHIIILFLLFPFAASGQSVGLVLSGGGAKGLYHVGVIRALEDNGIPVDYVSGTSIGAVVGGLYAIGYSPEQIGEILKAPDVENWISGRLSDRYNYYFKQMRENASMISLRLDPAKRGSQLPSNIVASDQLDIAFTEFFGAADVAAGGDFDRLMVPFRCVATDAHAQQAVVFRDGGLGMAVRSSMSIPFLFAPMKTGDMLLFDGGLFNNFPWQPLMEDFTPDVLIGSVCASSYLEGPDANLMEQAFMITMLHTDYRLPREGDVLIERSFPEVSMLDFGKADFLIAQGYADAMAQMDKIKADIRRRADIAELAARREAFRSRIPRLRFDEINISGLSPAQTGYVRRLLRIERDGMPFSFEKFKLEYFKILAEGDIDGGYPTVRYNERTGYFALDLTLAAKPSFKVMFGGNLSSTALNQIYVGLEYKKTGSVARSHNIDGYFSAFHSSVAIDNRIDFFVRSPLYAELGVQANFFNYFRSNYGFLVRGENVTYSKYRDHYATTALGFPSSRHSVVNVRLNAGQDEYLYFLDPAGSDDDDLMDRTRFRFIGAKLEYERKNLNYKMYPTRGIYTQLSAIYIDGTERFRPGASESGRISAGRRWFGSKLVWEEYFRKWTGWFSIGYRVEGVLTDRPDFTNEYASNISAPAFLPTPHSHTVYMKEFRANSYAAAGIMPIFHFGPNFYLKTNGYVFIPEKLRGVEDNVRRRMRYIFDASFVYQSILGPVSLSLSQYDTASNNWFITFNFGTALFNRKGLFY